MKIIKLLFVAVSAVWMLESSGIAGITITTLFTFHGTNGVDPEGKLVQGPDGDLYGTTRDTAAPGGNYGFGWYGHGTIFKITTNGTFTTLFAFSLTNGAFPRAGLILGNDGNFYGTTAGGGAHNCGTVFRFTPTGDLTTLVSFSGTNGNAPTANLKQGKDGNLYGTTLLGGFPKNGSVFGFQFTGGSLFRMTTNAELKVITLFNGTNGAEPQSVITQSKDGSLYGSTLMDGLDDSATNNPTGYGFGTIFKILPDGAVNTLMIFNGSNGMGPNVIAFDKDENLFGSTKNGGVTYSVTNDPYYGPTIIQGEGTIFRIGKNRKFTTLVQFYGANGSHPSDLLLGKDGNFYGSTYDGGADGKGTFFQMTPSGKFKVLHSFSGVGDDERISTLMQAKDGNFYGTSEGTFLGGPGSNFKNGRIFRLSMTP
jgi:uncharacterized repeat protein (TIGR03803 family)